VKKLLVVLLFALICTPFAAKADGGSPVYDISGTMVFTGNAGQTETINFDFDLGFTPCPAGCFNRGPYTPEVIGTPTVTSAGPLGEIYIGAWIDYEDFVYFGDPEGDEIDLRFPQTIDSEVQPTIANGEIYKCAGAICADQFNVIDPGNPYYPGGVNYAVTSITVTNVTPAPEPSGLPMLALGLFGLSLAPFARRSRA
jgi:MYXO-CTERM domain-containing protein